jgi:ABC-type transport system involved in multi-copper enzyme maturation permease subunit
MTQSTLIKVAWRIFATDVALGVLFIVAAITDTGDPAGRGLAEVFAVACALLLVVFAAILGLSTYFRSTIGLWLSIVLMVTPPILYVVGLASQAIDKWS